MVAYMPWSVALLLLAFAACGGGFVFCVLKALDAFSEASAIRATIQSLDPDDD